MGINNVLALGICTLGYMCLGRLGPVTWRTTKGRLKSGIHTDTASAKLIVAARLSPLSMAGGGQGFGLKKFL